MGDITGLPKGKLWQLSLLCARRNFTSPFDRDDDPEPVSPLLSQPILELCLRIPSWYQVHGHRDRALARDAFRDDLDPRIAGRTSKGGGEMLALSILERNQAFPARNAVRRTPCELTHHRPDATARLAVGCALRPGSHQRSAVRSARRRDLGHVRWIATVVVRTVIGTRCRMRAARSHRIDSRSRARCRRTAVDHSGSSRIQPHLPTALVMTSRVGDEQVVILLRRYVLTSLPPTRPNARSATGSMK